MNYEEIFETCNSIAVIGMSIYPNKAAHSVPLFMKKSGYTIYPVNPYHTEIAKMKSYNSINDIEENIDIVNVFRPSEFACDIIKEIIIRKQNRGDIKCIWLQEGVTCPEGRKLAEENNIIYIEDECMYKIFVSLDI